MMYAKRISIILIILCIICINTFAFGLDDPGFYNPDLMEKEDGERVGVIIGDILANVKVVGVCIAIVMLTIIGLKYIICSADEKANYKENMIPYVVGCFLLASATIIPSLIFDLVNK